MEHLSGFVPVNFKKVGKALVAIGCVMLLVKLTGLITGWYAPKSGVVILGVCLLLVGLYISLISKE